MAGRAPTRAIEKELWAEGFDVIVGIDEVGRGAWAGPLMVGAAILPRDKRVNGVRDSKMLTEKHREQLFDKVAAWCEAWAVGAATQQECDALGMAAAQKLAAERAIHALGVRPDAAVVDGKWDFVSPHVRHVEMRVKADRVCLSVAAASILAPPAFCPPDLLPSATWSSWRQRALGRRVWFSSPLLLPSKNHAASSGLHTPLRVVMIKGGTSVRL